MLPLYVYEKLVNTQQSGRTRKRGRKHDDGKKFVGISQQIFVEDFLRVGD